MSDLVRRAMTLANQEHLDNKVVPFNHLQNVAGLVLEEAGDATDEEKEILVTAAFLHHIREVSDLAHAELSLEFGEEVAEPVDALTRRKHESRQDHQRRLERNKLAVIIYRNCKLDLEAQ